MAAHHMTDMQLGHFVVGKIRYGITLLFKIINQVFMVLAVPGNLNTDKNLRFSVIRKAVVEFGNIAFAQGRTKLFKAAGLFRNSDTQNRFTLLTNFRALRDIAQAIKVSISATINGQEGLSFTARLFDIFFQAS